MVSAGGSLRNSGYFAGRLGASKHPHGMEEKGAREWTLAVLDCGIYGFQAQARGKVPVLEYQELFLGEEFDGWQ